MFGEEKVNNSVALLSGFGRFFSWSNLVLHGCCNSLRLCPFTRKDYIHYCHASRGGRRHGYQALMPLVLFMGRTVTHLVPRLIVIERAVMHASFALFRGEPTRHRFCTHCGPLFVLLGKLPT